jgi:predicted PurR-regulated permease PerM
LDRHDREAEVKPSLRFFTLVPAKRRSSPGGRNNNYAAGEAMTPETLEERRKASLQLDVLIRAGLVFALAALCYRIFSPFLTLMVWALILAVAIYPIHQSLARRLGGRQGLAATVIAIVGAVVIVWPTAELLGSLGDSVRGFVADVQNNTLHVPPPRAGVAEWPLVGEKIHAVWSQAHANLPAVVESMQPKIGDLARKALGFVAGIGLGVLGFLASFLIAGIIMAFGQEGARASQAIFARIMGSERAPGFVKLSTQTIRAVAQGVIGVALIQAIAVGVTLLVAKVPLAGVAALIVLVLGIAQVPALLVTIPAIAYIWASGGYSTGAAILYTVVLFVAGIADNFLKPLMLGRGVDAPMPVILLGALGGMASAGIIGLFVGAVLLALGYQIFMSWVHRDSVATETAPVG